MNDYLDGKKVGFRCLTCDARTQSGDRPGRHTGNIIAHEKTEGM